MLILGYFLCLVMGLTLGLIGAGGSILVFPILVYFFNTSPVHATSYSLVIVGLTALVGFLHYIKNRSFSFNISILFTFSVILATYLTRLYVLPNIPELIDLYRFQISKDHTIMFTFVIMMLISSLLIIKSEDTSVHEIRKFKDNILSKFLILFTGLSIGVFTGIIGAGGGFLIIPALVLLLKLEMKNAVGISLFIIFAKSFLGIIGDVQIGVSFDYKLICYISICTSIGIILGSKLNNTLNSNTLKKLFGVFTCFLALLIVLVELA